MKAAKSARINFRITESEHDLLKARAKAERMSVAGLLREVILNDQRETRRASVLEDQIVDFEKRLIATLKFLIKEMKRLNTSVQVSLSLQDAHLKSYLAHTPPPQEADREYLNQEAQRRYQLLIRAVHQGLSDERGMAEIARQLMQEGESDE